ncbi:MAG: amino acid-binding protein [Dorea sp.]|nr:amino acid-binding protein [Dorea sp.]
MISQLSVFVENRKGAILQITRILAEKKINIMGSMTDSGSEYGTIRMVVSDPELGYEALRDAGFMVSMKDVIGIEIEDVPGSMCEFLTIIDDMYINIDYTYLCFNRESSKPMIIIHTESGEEVEASLKYRGFLVH